MLRGLLALILADALGEALCRGLGIPASGAVVGMLLLVAAFIVRGEVPASIQAASQPLLRSLSVFFVPAASGVMGQAALVRTHWPAIALALLGSAILGLICKAAALYWLGRVSPHGAITSSAAEGLQ